MPIAESLILHMGISLGADHTAPCAGCVHALDGLANVFLEFGGAAALRFAANRGVSTYYNPLVGGPGRTEN